MKTLVVILSGIVMLSWTKENAKPTNAAASFDSTKASLLKKGIFVALNGPTSGMAKVYDQGGTKYIVFNPFQTHTEPELKVYLSKDSDALDYIKVGDLQSTAGNQVYVVPGNPNIGDYNYVHIWSDTY